MMPIRDVVIFPYMMTAVRGWPRVERARAGRALAGDKKIFLATQHDASIDEPRPDEIYHVGTIANIVQSLKLPDGNIKVLVEGVERARMSSVGRKTKGFFRAVVKVLAAPEVEASGDVERVEQAWSRAVRAIRQAQPKPELRTMIAAIRVDDPGKLADTVGANLLLNIEEKQELLEIFDPIDRLRASPRCSTSRSRSSMSIAVFRVARQAPDGEGAEGILPQRKDQGDPEGTGRGEKERNRRAEEEDRGRRHDQGRPRKGHRRAEAAGEDAADVGRIDRFAQLPRLAARGAVEEEEQGNPRSQVSRSRCSSRPLRARKDQGTHPRIPRGARAGEESQGLHPVLRRTSRGRQDLARHVDREGHRTASSSACRSAVCATKPKSAGIGAPISARCPVRSSR